MESCNPNATSHNEMNHTIEGLVIANLKRRRMEDLLLEGLP